MGLGKWLVKTTLTGGLNVVSDVTKGAVKGTGALAGKDVDVGPLSGTSKRAQNARTRKELKKQTKLLQQIAEQTKND
jgi:hypothetical protein